MKKLYLVSLLASTMLVACNSGGANSSIKNSSAITKNIGVSDLSIRPVGISNSNNAYKFNFTNSTDHKIYFALKDTSYWNYTGLKKGTSIPIPPHTNAGQIERADDTINTSGMLAEVNYLIYNEKTAKIFPINIAHDTAKNFGDNSEIFINDFRHGMQLDPGYFYGAKAGDHMAPWNYLLLGFVSDSPEATQPQTWEHIINIQANDEYIEIATGNNDPQYYDWNGNHIDGADAFNKEKNPFHPQFVVPQGPYLDQGCDVMWPSQFDGKTLTARCRYFTNETLSGNIFKTDKKIVSINTEKCPLNSIEFRNGELVCSDIPPTDITWKGFNNDQNVLFDNDFDMSYHNYIQNSATSGNPVILYAEPNRLALYKCLDNARPCNYDSNNPLWKTNINFIRGEKFVFYRRGHQRLSMSPFIAVEHADGSFFVPEEFQQSQPNKIGSVGTLILQANGNMVIHDGTGTIVWSSTALNDISSYGSERSGDAVFLQSFKMRYRDYIQNYAKSPRILVAESSRVALYNCQNTARPCTYNPSNPLWKANINFIKGDVLDFDSHGHEDYKQYLVVKNNNGNIEIPEELKQNKPSDNKYLFGKLNLQADGNMVVYQYSGDGFQEAIWSSGTNVN